MRTKNYSILLLCLFPLFITFLAVLQTGTTRAGNKEGRILFTSQGCLWSINPDGTDEEKLCHISDYKELLLSPDKKKIAGVKEKDVYIMNTDGSSALNITRSPEIETINAFSPYGDKIICALKRDPNETLGFLGIAKTDGTLYTKIDEYFIKKEQDIGWSPDREKITFTYKNILYILQYKGEWVKSPGSEELENLTPYNPSWSPDGERIAFRANKSGVGDLWIINIEKGYFRSIYSSDCHVQKSSLHAAEWSPGGGALVFETPHSELKENNIYMIFADGTSLKLMGKGFKPQWSPDSIKIFFQSEEGTMKIAETGLSGYNSSRKIFPSFYSPDLLKIVYTNKNKKEAWILDLQTKENSFLTGGDVEVLGWIEN